MRARNAAADWSVLLEPMVLGRLWSRLLEVEFVDRSVALAAKAFVSLFPFLILVTAFTPDSVRAEVLESLTNRFGITGDAFDSIRQAFATSEQTKTAAGILGVIITIGNRTTPAEPITYTPDGVTSPASVVSVGQVGLDRAATTANSQTLALTPEPC